MKSIMEEASTIVKAVEKAWQRAGKPQQFSVKVFEEPQRNFFGMTIRSAKIALLFQEKATSKQPSKKSSRQQAQRSHTPKEEPRKQTSKKVEKTQQREPQRKSKPQKEQWTPEMVDAARNWINQTLSVAGLGTKKFKTEVDRFHLKITFDGPVLDDVMKERTLFRSFAYLIMQVERALFKKRFKGFKVILSVNG